MQQVGLFDQVVFGVFVYDDCVQVQVVVVVGFFDQDVCQQVVDVVEVVEYDVGVFVGIVVLFVDYFGQFGFDEVFDVVVVIFCFEFGDYFVQIDGSGVQFEFVYCFEDWECFVN